MINRESNVKLFEELIDRCGRHPKLKEAISDSLEKQYVLPGDSPVPETANKYEQPATILVSDKRTIQAAAPYSRLGKKTCVLNFASATNPGGGVAHGAFAQEESLCRCTTLYPCISEEKTTEQFHVLHKKAIRAEQMDSSYNDDCIYTPDVIVCSLDDGYPYPTPPYDWFLVNVISCAAPNLRVRSNPRLRYGQGKATAMTDKELLALHKKRAERIFSLAAAEDNAVLILGAFGCGTFQNNPEVVAHAYKEVLPGYLHKFETIEFAIFCMPNEQKNLDAFRKILQ